MTELVICILPVYIVKPVQVILGKKVTVVFAFVFRVFVIITTIIRLVFMHKASSSTTMTLYSFETIVTTQLVLCISVLTACIPCLKPFLDAFDSGMLNVALHKPPAVAIVILMAIHMLWQAWDELQGILRHDLDTWKMR
ncbi:hypothetical protein N7454_006844 [Penicillium verhagenii]|nr:hypothetical protein N7454_006844 [Penicillium verhagenii]